MSEEDYSRGGHARETDGPENLDELKTDEKRSLVGAINELADKVDSSGAAALSGSVNALQASLLQSTSVEPLGEISGRVIKVRVNVAQAYDAGTSITVGDTNNPASLVTLTAQQIAAVGIYPFEVDADYALGGTLNAHVTNTTDTKGAASVIVEYIQA